MLIEQKTYTIGAKVPFVPVAAQTGAATAAAVKNIKKSSFQITYQQSNRKVLLHTSPNICLASLLTYLLIPTS